MTQADGTAEPDSGRHTFVDALRGFALFGVMAANLLIFSGFVYMTEGQKAAAAPTSLDRAVLFLELFFVENKFMGLFSVLFGVSSTLVPALVAGLRVLVSPPGAAGSEFDAMALAAFSSGNYRQVLVANWRYDWYLTNSIGQIAYQVAVFGRLLMGLYLARTLALGDLEAHRPLLTKVLAVGTVVGVVGNGVFATEWLADTAGNPWLAGARRFVVESGLLGFTLAYASALALAFQRDRWRRAIATLAPMGRMALTWFLAQTLVGISVFYGFASGLMGRVTPTMLAVGCVAGYAVQVALSHAWMRRFRFGPAEWIWRSLTYGTRQPLRRSLALGVTA